MRLISSSALLALRLRVQTCKYHAFFFGLLRKFGFRISTGEIEMDFGAVGSEPACAFEFFDGLFRLSQLQPDASQHIVRLGGLRSQCHSTIARRQGVFWTVQQQIDRCYADIGQRGSGGNSSLLA